MIFKRSMIGGETKSDVRRRDAVQTRAGAVDNKIELRLRHQKHRRDDPPRRAVPLGDRNSVARQKAERVCKTRG